MSVQILCFGTELLIGDSINTNLAYIGQQLDRVGIEVSKEMTIPDDPATMRACLEQALAEDRIVITIGGLGPTQDDRTRAVVSEVLGMPLVLDEGVSAAIQARYKNRNRVVPDHVWQVQSMVPVGGEAFPNGYGTAPGLWCPKGDRVVLMLPGPPRELIGLFEDHALARIRAIHPPTVLRASFAVFGLPESGIEARTIEVLKPWPEVDPAYSIKPGKCHVRLTVRPDQADILAAAVEALRVEFGSAYAELTDNAVSLLVDRLRANRWTLATAESCTGGGIGAFITEEAGVSDVYRGGVVAYANAVKESLLDVPAALLEAHGAVSEPVAAAMARGAQARLGTDTAIAVTGIAGPTGGTAEKPVGLVYIATAVGDQVRVSENHFRGNRAGVRDRTVVTALAQLRGQIEDLG